MYIHNSFESFKRTLWASSEETRPHHWKKLFLKRFFPCMMNATFIQSLVDPSFPSSYPESANESEMIKHNHKHWPNKVMILSSSLSFKKKKKQTKKHYQKEKIEMREEKLCLRLMAQPVEKRRKDQKGILKRWKRRSRRKGRREPNLHAASGQQYHHRVNEEKKKEKCAHNPNAFYRSPEKE